MTLPFAPIAMGLQLITGAASIAAQVAGANAQAAQNREQSRLIRQKEAQDYAALDLRQQQEAQNASAEILKNDRRARSAAATAQAAAGAAGVRGLSVDALLADLYGQQADFNAGVNMNLDRTGTALRQERLGVQTGTQSAFNSLTPITPPDYLGTALRTGTGVLGAYDRYRITPQSPGIA